MQSGCDETLKRMNRRYTTDEFRKVTKLLRQYYPNVALTTDIIVGFPGETEEEFNQTYNYLKEIKLYKMHVFQYSPRKGTKASIMPNQIMGNIKELRSKKLIELSNKNETEFLSRYAGEKVEVLFEQQEGKHIKGHTTNYMEVLVDNENIENTIKYVEVIKTEEMKLKGRLLV